MAKLWVAGKRTAQEFSEAMGLSKRQVRCLFNDPVFQQYLNLKWNVELPAKLGNSDKNKALYELLRERYHYHKDILGFPDNRIVTALHQDFCCDVTRRTVQNWVKDYEKGIDRYAESTENNENLN
jgi:hypothetical protein